SDSPHNFYPRPPRGGRLSSSSATIAPMRFLPTPSARKATGVWSLQVLAVCISTHALREEGDGLDLTGFLFTSYFYPRPPRGGRRKSQTVTTSHVPFLPTPSARRATCSLVADVIGIP